MKKKTVIEKQNKKKELKLKTRKKERASVIKLTNYISVHDPLVSPTILFSVVILQSTFYIL